MAITYYCDKCGKEYDWYNFVTENKEHQEYDYKDRVKYVEKHGLAPKSFTANCLKFMFFEPFDTNPNTNNGIISSKISDSNEYDNAVVFLCPDCMREFMSSLNDFWGFA